MQEGAETLSRSHDSRTALRSKLSHGILLNKDMPTAYVQHRDTIGNVCIEQFSEMSGSCPQVENVREMSFNVLLRAAYAAEHRIRGCSGVPKLFPINDQLLRFVRSLLYDFASPSRVWQHDLFDFFLHLDRKDEMETACVHQAARN